jgi:hypothetical protein
VNNAEKNFIFLDFSHFARCAFGRSKAQRVVAVVAGGGIVYNREPIEGDYSWPIPTRRVCWRTF